MGNAREEDVNHEYQTMERPTYDTSSFRPNSNAGRQLPPVPGSQDRIPSVPGYAKPYARPFDALPSPPPSPPSSDKGSNNKPLETDIGKKHALKRYCQFSLNTSLPDQILPPIMQFHKICLILKILIKSQLYNNKIFVKLYFKNS